MKRGRLFSRLALALLAAQLMWEMAVSAASQRSGGYAPFAAWPSEEHDQWRPVSGRRREVSEIDEPSHSDLAVEVQIHQRDRLKKPCDLGSNCYVGVKQKVLLEGGRSVATARAHPSFPEIAARVDAEKCTQPDQFLEPSQLKRTPRIGR